MADESATLPWEGAQKPGALPWENNQPDTLQRADSAIQGSIYHILTAFGHGVKGGFGSEPIATPATALSSQTEQTMKSFGINQTTLPGAAIGEAIRSAATAAELAGRTANAVIGGVVEVGGQALEDVGLIDKGQAAGSGAEAATDPEIQRLLLGIPELGSHPSYDAQFETALSRARAKGVVGPGGEAAHYDVAPVPPEEVVARQKAAADAGIPMPEIPPPPPTVHALAAKIEPEAVNRFHELQNEKDAHSQTLTDLAIERAASPEVAEAEAKVNDILKKVNFVEDRLTKSQAARLEEAQADLFRAQKSDTPAMAAVRAARLEADFAMRDLAPTVASAYRQAHEMMPEVTEPGAGKFRKAMTLVDEHEEMVNGNFTDAASAAAQPKDIRPDEVRAAKEAARADYLAKKAEAAKAVAEAPKEPVAPAPAEGTATAPTTGKPAVGGSLKPVEGTGDLKTRGLAEGVEAKAIEGGLTDNFGDLPEYHQLSMADQAAKSAAYLGKDYDAAKEVAMGRKAPPKGVLPESIFVAVEKRALAEGDIDTLRDLASSKLTQQATTMGQRIRTLQERDPSSPMGAIQEVQQAREAALKAKGDLDASKKSVVGDIKNEIRKSASPAPTWESFINDITCG